MGEGPATTAIPAGETIPAVARGAGTAGANRKPSLEQRRKLSEGRGWQTWPAYESAATGLSEFWYPVAWSNEIRDKPVAIRLCGQNIVLQRDADDAVYALNDRCPHRGVRLSQGDQQFPGTLSCPYHGWTFRLTDGELVAVITDGPDSKMCGNIVVQTFPVEERLGLVWVYYGEKDPHPLDEQLPEELVDAPDMAMGGRIEDRPGNWRFYTENGFDEGHAKYLHRTAWWRLFKVMPTWNKIHIERVGRWLFRVEDERHWSAHFPGVGTWSNHRWWKLKPRQQQGSFLGNTGGSDSNSPYIEGLKLPGFASLSLPGVLRIAYPQFIHYEFYVPIDADNTKYVGMMVQFRKGLGKAVFYAKYLSLIRWLFHGQFSGQDHWMVAETTAPPERLYRPDVSLIEWRRLFFDAHPMTGDPLQVASAPAAPASSEKPTSSEKTA